MPLYAAFSRATLILGLAALPLAAQRSLGAPSPGARLAPTALVDATDRYLDRGDVRIRYRVIGDGPPVLLLHGYTDRLEMWAGTADSLAKRHRVIVPDIRGFGQSIPRGAPPRYADAMVSDLVALLDAMRIDRVHVAGYSMGGLLATNLAIDHPSRVASASLIAPAILEEDAATAERTLAPYIAALATEDGLYPFFKWIVPTWRDVDVRAAAKEYMRINDRDALIATASSLVALTPDWAKVRRSCIPAIVVIGSVDPLVPHSERVAARWAGARLVHVEGADHIDITSANATLAAIRGSIADGILEAGPGGARARCESR